MYEASFIATSSADWAQSVELIDATTNLPLDIPDEATFKLAVDGPHGSSYLTASTEEGTITRPAPGVVNWHFTPSQMGRLCDGRTFQVGLTMTTTGGTVQLLRGTLSFLDGIVTP